MNQRAGTENVLEISGLGKACEIAGRDLEKNFNHLKEMHDALYEGIVKAFPKVKLNGHPNNRLPNTLSLSFPEIEANVLLDRMSGVAASAGAACHTSNIKISSVLSAMKIPEEIAMGTIRFSTGKFSNKDEIEKAVNYIVSAANDLYSSR